MDASTILTVLNELTAKLQGPAEHMYNVLLRQALIEGFTFLGLGLLLAVLFGGLIKLLDVLLDGGVVVSYVVKIVATIFVVVYVLAGLKRLFNPEYYAIAKLLEVLR